METIKELIPAGGCGLAAVLLFQHMAYEAGGVVLVALAIAEVIEVLERRRKPRGNR